MKLQTMKLQTMKPQTMKPQTMKPQTMKPQTQPGVLPQLQLTINGTAVTLAAATLADAVALWLEAEARLEAAGERALATAVNARFVPAARRSTMRARPWRPDRDPRANARGMKWIFTAQRCPRA